MWASDNVLSGCSCNDVWSAANSSVRLCSTRLPASEAIRAKPSSSSARCSAIVVSRWRAVRCGRLEFEPRNLLARFLVGPSGRVPPGEVDRRPSRAQHEDGEADPAAAQLGREHEHVDQREAGDRERDERGRVLHGFGDEMAP